MSNNREPTPPYPEKFADLYAFIKKTDQYTILIPTISDLGDTSDEILCNIMYIVACRKGVIIEDTHVGILSGPDYVEKICDGYIRIENGNH